jgi:hypothetical protein
VRCPGCGYEKTPEGEAACGMCRAPLRKAAAAEPPSGAASATSAKSAPRGGSGRGGLSDLGGRVAHFEQSITHVFVLPVVGVLLLLGAAACAFGLQDINARVTGGLFLGGFGLAAVALGLQNRGRTVDLHQNGLIRRKGVEREIVLWDDVRTVHQEIVRHSTNGVPTGTSFVYTLRCRDGRELVFENDLVEIQALGEQLLGVMKRRLLPAAIEAFERGEIVEFGEVSVSQKGIRLRTDRLLPWPNLRMLDVEEGYLTFDRPGGPPDRIQVSRIPNLPVFLGLVQHGARRGAGE